MSTSPAVPTVFVTSATGSQGSALCRQLREVGWDVRATTRDPSSPTVTALAALGVHFTPGSWDDEDALRAGLEGCDKLFLCLLPNLTDFEQAPRRAQLITKTARACGVRQAVVSTTLGTAMLDDGGAAPIAPGAFFGAHLASKQRVEQAVVDAGFEHWTILRPAFFMANFIAPKIEFGYTETRDRSTWTNCMTPDSPLSLVDHVDIARFAAAAFRDPGAFHGRRIGVASEEILVQDALDRLAAAIGDGRAIKAIFMGDEEIAKAQAEGSWLFFASEPCCRYMSDYTDMAELVRLVPGLTTFEQFLEREREGVRQTYGVHC
ncbi:NmrA family protein [Apodospora peruviana]|uniref:NmrA family protein n=1 Tax=Apodospora peruviana TaxID=516989 RepID=A0AAE0ISX6_9PEZI|nr:NmrA family protein [Apodospora peruviana]